MALQVTFELTIIIIYTSTLYNITSNYETLNYLQFNNVDNIKYLYDVSAINNVIFLLQYRMNTVNTWVTPTYNVVYSDFSQSEIIAYTLAATQFIIVIASLIKACMILNLRSTVPTNETSYLKEIDTTNFKSHIIPETKPKRDLYLHLLPLPEKFLKKYFVLRHAGIDMKCCQLFEMYRESEEFKQGTTPHNFYSHLSEIGFKKKTVKGYDMYKISYDELLAFGKKRKWFDEADRSWRRWW